jgi:hypothetical protein
MTMRADPGRVRWLAAAERDFNKAWDRQAAGVVEAELDRRERGNQQRCLNRARERAAVRLGRKLDRIKTGEQVYDLVKNAVERGFDRAFGEEEEE